MGGACRRCTRKGGGGGARPAHGTDPAPAESRRREGPGSAPAGGAVCRDVGGATGPSSGKEGAGATERPSESAMNLMLAKDCYTSKKGMSGAGATEPSSSKEKRTEQLEREVDRAARKRTGPSTSKGERISENVDRAKAGNERNACKRLLQIEERTATKPWGAGSGAAAVGAGGSGRAEASARSGAGALERSGEWLASRHAAERRSDMHRRADSGRV